MRVFLCRFTHNRTGYRCWDSSTRSHCYSRLPVSLLAIGARHCQCLSGSRFWRRVRLERDIDDARQSGIYSAGDTSPGPDDCRTDITCRNLIPNSRQLYTAGRCTGSATCWWFVLKIGQTESSGDQWIAYWALNLVSQVWFSVKSENWLSQYPHRFRIAELPCLWGTRV